MSDTTPTPSADPIKAVADALVAGEQPKPAIETPKESATPEQGNPADDAPLGDAGKQALDRMKAERNEAKKQAADLKAQLDKIQSANMTDLERAQKEAEEAKAEAAKVPQLVAEQLRGHLAEIHKISDEDQVLYLTSDDPSVLLKQAMGIASRTSTAPKPDLSQGAQQAPALNSDGLTEALARAVGAR